VVILTARTANRKGRLMKNPLITRD